MTKKALILCAGFGSRMKELTKDCPKPMLKINDKPILEHTLLNLKKAGITEVAINVHYLKDRIMNYFNDGKKWGMNITYLVEDIPTGTAGPVKKLSDYFCHSESFLVLYGDIITDEDFNVLLNAQRLNNGIGTIYLHRRMQSNSVVEIDENNCIKSFFERPTEAERQNIDLSKGIWVNSGLYCFKPEILNYIPKDKFCDFPKDIFPILVKERKLFGQPLTSYRCAIDTIERFEEACRHFKDLK